MRYPTEYLVYGIHMTLREAYRRRSQGQTFNPPYPVEEIMARLSPAVSRPRQTFQGVSAHPTFFRKVAALGHAIASGHCFGNGNKRTAFSAMGYMLNANGWSMNMPDDVVALLMLRIASNRDRMVVEHVATVIGAYARRSRDKRLKYISDKQVRDGLLLVDLPDRYPAPAPRAAPAAFQERASQILAAQAELLSEDEAATYRDTFGWPSAMYDALRTWGNVKEYAKFQRYKVRRRGRRAGKLRRPHNGGRTVKRLCGL
jgi:death-on-curing protein